MSTLLYDDWQPFNFIDDVDLERLLFSNELFNQNYNLDLLNKTIFEQFSRDIHNTIVNSDPDINFFSEIRDKCNQCTYYFIDSLKEFNKVKNKFSICSLNINSISKNFDTFTELFLDESGVKFDIIGLCESKLSNEIENLFNINNYSMYTLNNRRNKGGLLMYVNNKYNDVSIRNELSKINESIEVMVIEISVSRESILCVLIYHRPGSNKQNFLNDVETLIELISRENKKMYVFGDFNINLIDKNNIYSKQLIDTMHSHNLFNLIIKPTRVTDTSATAIDHIWTNNAENCKCNGIVYETISDHFPTFAVFNGFEKHIQDTQFINKTFRKLNDSNKMKFKNDLSNLTWDNVLSSRDPNTSYNNFIEIFSVLFHDNFPLITKIIKLKDLQKPYITPEIKNLIINKNKLQKKFSKRPLSFGDEYRQVRNLVNAEVRKAKSEYYKSKLEDCAGDAKSVWKVINNVLKRDQPNFNNKDITFIKNCNDNINVAISDPIEVSNSFNEHFINVGKSLSDKLPNTDLPPSFFYGPRIDGEIDLKNTNESEVVKMIASLRDGAAGCDEIPISLIKYVSHQIKTPLAHIFNLSINLGIFPEKLKMSKVIPIHKSNSKSDFSNYRPISLLPVISKILEKIIYTRLNDYVHKNNIISSTQHGFIEKKSTTSATLCLTDYTLNALDNNKFTIGIFLDLSKAFDSVNHDILLHKLEHFGIRNTALKLISSYLSNRKQYVRFNNSDSDFKTLTHSIPQGSILGPLLFNIYINDINNSVNKLKLVLYADDSCFYLSHHDIHTLIDLANLELNCVGNWLISNKLTLNTIKSHYLIFSRNRSTPTNTLPIKINNKILELKQSTNYLGINLQSNLKWNNHINYLSSKLQKYNSILYLTRNHLTRSSLL